MTFGQFLSGILSSPEFSAFIIATVIGFAGWLGKQLNALINQKVSGEQLKVLISIAENAVRVAEQTGASKTGAEKKAEAVRVAQSFLDAYGIKVSAAQLEGAIEAAVYSELTVFKPLPEPTDGPSDPGAPEATNGEGG
jgi:LL-H family phage holin